MPLPRFCNCIRYPSDDTMCREDPSVGLLRARFSVLSTLRVKFYRRVELLLDPSFGFQCLFRLFSLRGAAGGGRNCSLTHAAGGERNT